MLTKEDLQFLRSVRYVCGYWAPCNDRECGLARYFLQRGWLYRPKGHKGIYRYTPVASLYLYGRVEL